jgi:hypothetical protein
MEFMTQTLSPSVHLCHQVSGLACPLVGYWNIPQKLPALPLPRNSQPLINSILGCCVLWLRHNLHKRLEINSYTLSFFSPR